MAVICRLILYNFKILHPVDYLPDVGIERYQSSFQALDHCDGAQQLLARRNSHGGLR